MGIRRNCKKKYHHTRDDDLYNEKLKDNYRTNKHEDTNIEGTLDDNVNRVFHPNTDEINVEDQIQLLEIKAGKCIYYE